MKSTTSLACLCLVAGFATPAAAEKFVQVGLSAMRVESRIANQPGVSQETVGGAQVGIGARRTVGDKGDFGIRIELDDLDGDLMISVRALDYRRHLSERFALSFFAGAARLERPTAAFGYYYGAGLQVKEIATGWDLSVDLRVGDEIARDNLLPTDPQGGSPDNFFDLLGVSVSLTRKFGK